MMTNKIVLGIISITALISVPFQIITTFILGILVKLTFGLILLPFSLIWIAVFLGPLLGLSYIYERVSFTRPFVAIIGIPFAILGDTYVALLPSMGEWDSRFVKMIYCQTFPYTWSFHQFTKNKFDVDSFDVFEEILDNVSQAKPLGEYIDKLRTEFISK